MTRAVFFVLFFCSCSISSVAQNEWSPDKSFEIAENFRKKAKTDSAVFYYSQAAESFERSGEIGKWLDCYNQLGIIYTRQDSYVQAKKYLEAALATLQKRNVPANLTAATTFISLGVLYAAEKKYTLSIQYHFQSLAIRRGILGENAADVATSYGNIGNVYLAMNQADSAVFFHQKARAIREKLFGEKGGEVMQSYTHLGHSYKAQKNYAIALSFYEKALANKILQRGEAHKETARFYTNLSELYYLMGKTERGAYYKSLSEKAINE